MDWNSAILWGIISLLSTIFFGFLFGYIFYKKSIKKKKLYIYVNSNILISEDLSNYEGIKILYNSEEIVTLTSSTIIISNIGNDIVEINDVISSDPIIITTSEKFLSNKLDEYNLITSNKKVTATLQKIDDSTLQLVFEFLRPKDKIKVTLLHSGIINIEGELKIGTIEKNIDFDQNDHLKKMNIFEEIMEIEINILRKMSPYFTILVIIAVIFLYVYALIF